MICGQEFKRLTANHLKKHDLTLQEYNKIYDKEKYYIKRCIDFLEEYYIEIHYRYVEVIKGYQPTTITNDFNKKGFVGLSTTDLKHHIQGRKNIAMYFPKSSTKVIGFDVDTLDFTVVQKVHNAIINRDIPKECIAISFSGNKGYHIDVFLDKLLGFYYTKRFYNLILEDTGLSDEIVEGRGINAQAYKLPITTHVNTKRKCCFYDENKNELDTLEAIENYKKVDIALIKSNVLEDSKSKRKQLVEKIKKQSDLEAKNEEMLVEFEKIDSTVNPQEKYSITNTAKIKACEKLLAEGYNENHHRNPTILKIATYFKDVKGLCLKETIEAIDIWINEKWDKSLIDREFTKKKEQTIKDVYNKNMTFWTSAADITISLPEIREVFSVKTSNKQQTQALRKLYYILLLHHKAYARAEKDWVFYMTYEQMTNAGAVQNNRAFLLKQLQKLEDLGKLNIVSRNQMKKGSIDMKVPNEYRLSEFNSLVIAKNEPVFNICKEEQKCVDCIYIALCSLSDDKERRLYIKGKEYKQLPECPYNP